MFKITNWIKFGVSAVAALIVLLLLYWVADTMYRVGEPVLAAAEGTEGAEGATPAPPPVRGFVIAAAEEESAGGAEAEAPAEVTFTDLYAAADPANGEKAFKKCKACHSLEEGQNGTGPSLYGVVGRAIGTAPGFSYSDDLAGNGGTWTPEELNIWLEDPKAYASGSKMNTKTKKIEDRASLVAYLATIGG